MYYLCVFQGMSELPDYNKISFQEQPPIPLEDIVPDAAPEALDLLKRFLVYPTKQRISAKEVKNYILAIPERCITIFIFGDMRQPNSHLSS